MTQRLREADPEAFKNALAQADISRAQQVLGLSQSEAEELSQRLGSAGNALFTEFPELVDFLPRRSLADDPRALAIFLERILSDEEALQNINFLDTLPGPAEGYRAPYAAGLKAFEGSLNFIPPPLPGFDNPGGPCINPSCSPDGPPGTTEPPPDSIWWDTDCAWVPFTASVALCSALGPTLYWACAAVAACHWCEGGWIDDACEP